MNRKQRIIVSVTGIFLVLLILVGLTYAYFLTKINGNTNDKSISVTTANLELKYDDINDILISENAVEPGKSWVKTFSATNEGNKAVTYGVALENLVNTLERTEDLVYTLECKEFNKGDEISSGGNVSSTGGTNCTGVTETEFPTLSSIIVQNTIAVNKVQAYTLTVTYKEANTNQSVDMGKQFSAKVNIVDPNTFGAYGTGTLASAIISSAKKGGENRTTWGTSTIPNLADTSSTERVLNSAPDDYGTSYYFRGNVLDNNVNFLTYNEDLYAGHNSNESNSEIGAYYSSLTECQNASTYNKKCTLIHKKGDTMNWKIVRINGDGSVRLVLDGSIGSSIFNLNSNDNAYVGYMYGLAGQTSANTNQCVKLNSDGTAAEVDTTNTTEETCVAAGNKWAATPYDATHTNVVSSTIKTNLESWYKTNIVDTNNTTYIAENIFCNDKSLKSGTGIGGGTNETIYNGYYSTSLECAKGEDNNYSRFTSKNNTSDTTIKGVKVNNDLIYPIGILSRNEVKYAGIGTHDGSKFDTTKSYLYNSNISFWWLLSPGRFSDSKTIQWLVYSQGLSIYYVNGIPGAYRPSINLKVNVLTNGGDGTKENPYTLKLQ